MATRSSQRSFGWALTASALALASALGLAACQSSDADADDETSRAADERDEEPEQAAEPREPARVPERSPESDDEAEDGAAIEEEPASEQSSADAPSEGAAETPAAGDTQTPVAAAQAFSACWTDSGLYSDCESIFVTVTQASPARCIQLTIDNCGTYGRQGLSADAPTFWRLAGGSIGDAAAPCEFGVFYSSSTSIADASGSVSWDETTSRPSALVLDLSLEPSGGVSGDAEPIPLATPEALEIAECEE